MTPPALFDALEAHRRALIARLDVLPPAMLSTPPAEGTWSLAQIVDHLARVDGGLRLSGRPASALVRTTSRTRADVLNGVLRLPLRIPAPPGAAPVLPSDAPDYEAVRDTWAARRADWARRLHEADPEAIAYRHPLMGPFLLREALSFLLAHHRHHDPQVERTLRAVAR